MVTTKIKLRFYSMLPSKVSLILENQSNEDSIYFSLNVASTMFNTTIKRAFHSQQSIKQGLIWLQLNESSILFNSQQSTSNASKLLQFNKASFTLASQQSTK